MITTKHLELREIIKQNLVTYKAHTKQGKELLKEALEHFFKLSPGYDFFYSSTFGKPKVTMKPLYKKSPDFEIEEIIKASKITPEDNPHTNYFPCFKIIPNIGTKLYEFHNSHSNYYVCYEYDHLFEYFAINPHIRIMGPYTYERNQESDVRSREFYLKPVFFNKTKAKYSNYLKTSA